MPAPENSSTFEELVIHAARLRGTVYYGAGGAEAPQAPVNGPDKAQAEEDANRALSEFYGAHDWGFLEPVEQFTLSSDGTGPLNIDGDPARYRLGGYIAGPPDVDPTYDDGSGMQGDIVRSTPAKLAALHGQPQTSGRPQFCAFRPNHNTQDQGEDTRFWELWVWPDPDSAYTVTFPVRVNPHRLQELDLKHVAGGVYDFAIKSCLEWVVRREDTERADARERARAQWEDRDLPRAREIDRRQKSGRSLGTHYDASLRGRRMAQRGSGYKGLQFNNGVAVQ